VWHCKSKPLAKRALRGASPHCREGAVRRDPGSLWPGRLDPLVGIFPNDEAIDRLLGPVLLEPNHEWAVQRARYMTLETIAAPSDDPLVGLPAMVI
jgi:hypothetical protein